MSSATYFCCERSLFRRCGNLGISVWVQSKLYTALPEIKQKIYSDSFIVDPQRTNMSHFFSLYEWIKRRIIYKQIVVLGGKRSEKWEMLITWTKYSYMIRQKNYVFIKLNRFIQFCGTIKQLFVRKWSNRYTWFCPDLKFDVNQGAI